MDDTQAPATEPAAAEAPKVAKNALKPCFCSFFEVGHFDPDVEDKDVEIFSTGCTQQTQRTFAQGHDARLVSFLVDGFFDGYDIRLVEGGVAVTFGDPESAAARASASLAAKAAVATENRRIKLEKTEAIKAERASVKQAKAQEKAEKAASKAAAKAAKEEAAKASKETKETPHAEVVAGSAEGDGVPTPEGWAKIKVGRFEYNATIDEQGRASFVNGKGEDRVIERDGYRLLQNA